jgi:L-malate glycosyltransferase
MRVLYVNHTAEMSGAERSLLDLLAALPARVEPVLGAPPGRLTEAARAIGIETVEIAGTAGSLRPHPLHTPRAVAELGMSSLGVGRAARRVGADLVHANSIRAGISLCAARVGGAARVVHVRDCLPAGPLTTATMRLLAARASTIVANSAYTARTIRDAAPSARPEVVHNPVDLGRWDPARVDRAQARSRLGPAGEREPLLGVVAQLSPWKGQDTAIEALGLLREQGVDAHLLLIGSAKFLARATRYDNRAYAARLDRLIADHGLGERVSLLGEREDVPALVRALDVLLLPSWEEPFGRALIEAMAMEVAVVATDVGGPSEIIGDGREGLLVAPREPRAWARAIRALADDAELRREMGRAGRRRVERAFTVERHAGAMVALYDRALSATGTRNFTLRSTARA